MIIHRTIGKTLMDIDIHQANEIYLDDFTAEQVQAHDLRGIIDAIFAANHQEHMPLNLFMELTNQCIFKCPFCYVNEPGCRKASLPRFDDGLKDMLEFLIGKGLVHVTLSGGEPLMHPDFIRLYSFLKESGILVTVFTNAYIITAEHISLLERLKPFKCEVSIYGIDNKSYLHATGIQTDVFRVFNNVLELKKAGINVVCKTPLTSLTEESYPAISQWCSAHGIPFYTGIDLVSSYSGESRDNYMASQSIRDKIKKEADADFFSSPERIAMASSERKGAKKAFDCSGGLHHMFISSDNKLMPCMQAQWAGDEWKFDIGNGIAHAYDSMVASIRREKNKPIRGCSGCRHARICQQCYFTQNEYDSSYCKNLEKYMKGGCNHV